MCSLPRAWVQSTVRERRFCTLYGLGGGGAVRRDGAAGRRDSGAPSSSCSLTARHTPYPYLPLKRAHLSTHVYPGHDVAPHSKPLMSPLTPLLPSEVPALLKRFISIPHPSHTGPNTTAWKRFIPTDNRTSSRPPFTKALPVTYLAPVIYT